MPSRDRFLRPFGCGLFIREFLLGNGPQGSSRIDPNEGALQVDIRAAYKEALYHALAQDQAEWDISNRVRRGKTVTEGRPARSRSATSAASPTSSPSAATTAS
ncbi:MAG: hypothetical protein Q8P50_11315 [Bacillota bacterium]|nr:hypothetical protein [Bacillota bacterium]